MAKSTMPPPIPQPPPVHTPAPSWHPQPPFPPQAVPQVVYGRPSPAIKVEDPVFSVNAIPKAAIVDPAVKVQGDHFANLLSTLLKAGVVSANATPTGAGATSKESAATAAISKSVESSEAVIREYRNVILAETVNLNSLDSVRYVVQLKI